MKMLRDNYRDKPTPILTTRKKVLLTIPIALSMAMMYCGKKVNSILYEDIKDTIENISPELSQAEKADISEGWKEAREDQVLIIYRVKNGDTLSDIARRHDVTLESILSINKKITSPDTIKIGQAILIPYDGNEESDGVVKNITPVSEIATQITFTQSSLKKIMQDVLTRPGGDMLGAIGNQPSDLARLRMIAEKTELGGNVADVRYANLCAANMRAVIASLREHLEAQGINIDLSWKNGKNGIGVGKYFAELSTQKRLPRGFDVIQTKSNPDPTKLKQMLLNKGKEYSIFVLSYSHDVDGHVNIAFRVGDDIVIFDPSWKGKSKGWPERFHKFEDYIDHFVDGKKTPGYAKANNRYDLYNVTCVPAHRTDAIGHLVQKKQHSQSQKQVTGEGKITNDMRELTMVFEGFAPRMHVDTKKGDVTTYAIGYGTNIGTMQDSYPFGSFGKDVASYLEKHGHDRISLKQIMHGKQKISEDEGRGLFEMRYIPRYQKIRTLCGKNWHKYPPVIRNMLVDMSYNMGESAIFPSGSNPGFPDAVAALNRGDWVGFINAVVDSKYARDVGARRLGKWVALIVRDILKGKTSGLSQEALDLRSTYTTKHSKDLNREMAKR